MPKNTLSARRRAALELASRQGAIVARDQLYELGFSRGEAKAREAA